MAIQNENLCPIRELALANGLPPCNDECLKFETLFTLETGPSCPHTDDDRLFEPSTRIIVIMAEEVQTF